jgi:hypothetical protein
MPQDHARLRLELPWITGDEGAIDSLGVGMATGCL